MKKQILLFMAFTGLTLSVSAQTTIPNGGFETWTNVSSATAQPTDWNSNKTSVGGYASFGPQTCYQDTSTLGGGSYCVKILTGSALGQIVNGSCATGEVQAPTTTKADGFIETIAGDAAHSAPFTGRPDSLVFWYRYTPGTGSYASDTPSVQARLHVGNAYAPEAPSNGNHPDSTVNIIARAIWAAGSTQATWQRVSVPFVYVAGSAGARTPQYILITMTSSADNAGGNAGSTLWVDQMEAIYNANGINQIGAADYRLYPNPASDQIQLDLSRLDAGMMSGLSEIVVYDILGSKVKTLPISQSTISVRDLSDGVYMIGVADDKQNVKILGKFNVLK